MVADSYLNFTEILMKVKQLSIGRENPVKLESNPISVEDIGKFISDVESKNMKSEIWYWENLFD